MKRVSQSAVVLVLGALAFAQSNEVAPNENLVAEGIPKIPVSLAESVGRYSEFRSAFFCGLASDASMPTKMGSARCTFSIQKPEKRFRCPSCQSV